MKALVPGDECLSNANCCYWYRRQRVVSAQYCGASLQQQAKRYADIDIVSPRSRG